MPECTHLSLIVVYVCHNNNNNKHGESKRTSFLFQLRQRQTFCFMECAFPLSCSSCSRARFTLFGHVVCHNASSRWCIIMKNLLLFLWCSACNFSFHFRCLSWLSSFAARLEISLFISLLILWAGKDYYFYFSCLFIMFRNSFYSLYFIDFQENALIL